MTLVSSLDHFQRLRKAVPMSFKWPISNRMPISLNRLNSTNKWRLLLISARSTPSEQVQTPLNSSDRTKDDCFSRSFSCRRFEYSPAFDWIRRSRSRNGLQLSLPRSDRYHRRSVYTNLQRSACTVRLNRYSSCDMLWCLSDLPQKSPSSTSNSPANRSSSLNQREWSTSDEYSFEDQICSDCAWNTRMVLLYSMKLVFKWVRKTI